MKFISGTKEKMTQYFDSTGKARPATLVKTPEDVSVFAPGDLVKLSEREPGSIGGGLRTRVPKGMRMAGRMGGERVTVLNLEILAVAAENKEILIGGAVPGRRGTKLEIRA